MRALQPCDKTISNYSALKLAKYYSQHSADQLPYDQSLIEYFQSLFSLKHPEKDIMVCLYYHFFCFGSVFINLLGMACTTWSIWSFWITSNCTRPCPSRAPGANGFCHCYLLEGNIYSFIAYFILKIFLVHHEIYLSSCH